VPNREFSQERKEVGCGLYQAKNWWDAIRALLGQRRKDRQVKEKVQVAITVVFNIQIRISAPPPFQKLMQSSWGLQGFSGGRGG